MGKKLKIVYAGNYSKGEGYPRTNVLLEGLSSIAELTEIRYPLWDKKDKERELKKPLATMLSFFKSCLFFLKHSENMKNGDIVIVGFPGYAEIFLFKLIKILTGAQYRIVFDYFFSVYESLTMERKVVKPQSFFGKLLYLFDKAGIKTADKVLIDTEPHKEFVQSLLNLSVKDSKKFIVLPVGETEKKFPFLEYPKKKIPFNILFFGTFLNLHGIDKIKRAIELLEDKREIKFILIGKGKNDSLFKERRFKNTEFVNRFVPPEELLGFIKKSHAVLGIFGDNQRADKVIPCKIYDALACGRPIITGKTKAAEQLFQDKEFVILCDKNGKSVADSIEKLHQKNIEELSNAGKQAYLFFKENFSPKKIAFKLIKEINE